MSVAKVWLLTLAALARGVEDEKMLLALPGALLQDNHVGGPQATLALLQELSYKAVKEGLEIDDFTKQALGSIKDMLQSTSGKLVESHDADQELLDGHAAKMTGCQQEEETEEQEDNDTDHVLYDSQQAHIACRQDLHPLEFSVNETLKRLDEHMQAQREAPPDCEKPTEVADVEKYYLALQKFAEDALPVWRKLESEYKAAQHAFHHLDHHCDRLQNKFEFNYCSWRFQTIATCSMYFSCMSRAQDLFETTKEAVMKNAASRKLDFKAIEQITCNVDVLMLPSDDSGREGAYTTCANADPDTSHLDIAAPDLSHLKPCDLSAVKEYPCTEGFLTHNHYHEMTSIHTCHPCPELPKRLHAAIASLEE